MREALSLLEVQSQPETCAAALVTARQALQLLRDEVDGQELPETPKHASSE